MSNQFYTPTREERDTERAQRAAEQAELVERLHQALLSVEKIADELSSIEQRNAALIRASHGTVVIGEPQANDIEGAQGVVADIEALELKHREVLARLTPAVNRLRSLLSGRGFNVDGGELGSGALLGLRNAVRASGLPVPRRST